MTNIVVAKFEEYDRKIFWVVACLGGTALFAYVYFIGISVFAVVGRKEAEFKAGRTSAAVAELESAYAVLDGSIDPKMAEASGFLPVSDPRYISRENADAVVALGNGPSDR